MNKTFEEDLNDAVSYHGHLCVGQILGVRMARYGCAALNIDDPRKCRDLMVFVENDRCLSDAIGIVTGCSLGKRRLKHRDYGKSAASFVNIETGEAVRVSSIGWSKGPSDKNALLEYFQKQSDSELFRLQRVEIKILPQDMPGPPTEKVQCTVCGEFVTDSRHLIKDGMPICKPCANDAYYKEKL
jgi:formylmethanofuran dehydrogenase subunit E